MGNTLFLFIDNENVKICNQEMSHGGSYSSSSFVNTFENIMYECIVFFRVIMIPSKSNIGADHLSRLGFFLLMRPKS